MTSILLIASVVGFCSAGRLDNIYTPSNYGSSERAYSGLAHTQPGQGTNLGPFSGAASFQAFENSGAYQKSSNAYHSHVYSGALARQQSSQEINAQILRSNSDANENGYAYDFETSNGIRADQSASVVNGVQAQGSFAYKGDDGHDYSITYTADENGYQPRGDHIPTSPPIPEAILRSLEQNAREEAAGGSSDGSYQADSFSYNGGVGEYNGPVQQSAAFQPQVLANSASGQYHVPRQQFYNARSGYQY